MRNEKPLEQGILDRFFKSLSEMEDFPQEMMERLLHLRRADSLRNREKVLEALERDKNAND